MKYTFTSKFPFIKRTDKSEPQVLHVEPRAQIEKAILAADKAKELFEPLKVGDRVITKKFKDLINGTTYFVPQMREFVGQEGVVTALFDNGNVYVHNWAWPSVAVELVKEPTYGEHMRSNPPIPDPYAPDKISLRANAMSVVRSFPGLTCKEYAEKLGIPQKRLSSTLSDMESAKLLTSSKRDFGKGSQQIKVWKVR